MRTGLKRLTAAAKPALLDRVLDEAALFLAAVFFVLLLLATDGLDLSPGLF